jgi:hypothetical protein
MNSAAGDIAVSAVVNWARSMSIRASVALSEWYVDVVRA